jgi:hypothetical protein
MIDYWKLTRDFKPGDVVQKYIPGRKGDLSPYYGRVTAVMQGIGFLDVQWPFGNERLSPEEVVKLNPEFLQYLPPSLNFSWYPGLDTTDTKKATVKNAWRDAVELPPGFHKELAKLFHRGVGEIQAYDELWHRYASVTEDEPLRDETRKFYAFARNAFQMFFGAHVAKTAMYWMAQNRQHRVTRKEVDSRRPTCPKCGSPMRKAIYKMREGQRLRLFACPQDMYLIKQDDIRGPDGNPVEW